SFRFSCQRLFDLGQAGEQTLALCFEGGTVYAAVAFLDDLSMAAADVFFDVAESFRDDPFGHRTREVAHENYRPSGGVGVPVLAASTRAEFALDQAHSITELGATITAPCSGDDAPSYGKRVCLGVSSFGEGNLERAGLDGAA